jgi:pSer/pThr/pTyr-binding forkhead associated (FHA) protein
MKKYLFLLLILSACTEKVDTIKSQRAYTIAKSDDNNWTTSGRVEADSFQFINEHHIVFYVDGQKSNLMGQIIKVYTNEQ